MAHFERLETPRLALRRLRPDDLTALVGYRTLPEVARYQGWDGYDAERGRSLIEDMRGREPGEPGWFQFAIARREDDALLGDCALRTDAADPRLGEVGFTLAPAHQGRGLGEEAVRALVGLALGPLGLHRVVAVTDARNAGAARLLERVGFRREGHLVEASWFKGEWTDELHYALLAREWAERAR